MNRCWILAASSRSAFAASMLLGAWATVLPTAAAQDGEPLPPVPPSAVQTTAQADDPLLQEIIDRADELRLEESEAELAPNSTDSSENGIETVTPEAEEDTLLFGPGTSDRNDSTLPVPIPENPDDIITPDEPPALDLPDELPSVQDLETGETLQLPQDPLQVRVESVQQLTLEDAYSLALENNPTIRQAELDVEIARSQVVQARGEFFPVLSTSVNYSFADPAAPDPASPFDPADSSFDAGSVIDSNIQNSLTGQVRLDFVVIDGGGRIARNLIADQAVAIAEFNLDQTTQAVQLDVAEAYYSLQLADTNVLVTEAQVNDSQTSLDDAEARERAGIGTRFEVLQAQSELANDEVALIDALNDRRVARFDLARVLSFDSTVEAVAVDPINATENWELSLEDTIVLAFENRSEFESLREQVEQARQNAQNALSNVRPNVSLFSTFDYQADFDGDSSGNPFLEEGYSVGATFNWTFFDGFQSLASAQQADLERAQTQSSFEEARDNIRFEVEQAFFNLNSFREQIDAAKVGLDSAQEELRLARLRFEAGVGTQTDVLNAQTRLAEARQNLANSISNYNLSIVQLQRAVNGL